MREGTLLAMRANRTAKHAQSRGKPWICEQPRWRAEGTSMRMLDEFQELEAMDGVRYHTFDQCMFDASFEKKTDLMPNIEDDIMIHLQKTCDHEKQWWIIPWSAETHFSSHPPLKGKQMAIPAEQWQVEMQRRSEPEGKYLTRSTASYPLKLNAAIAGCLRDACRRTLQKSKKDVTPTGGSTMIEPDTQVTMSGPLTGEHHKDEIDDANSLRNVHKWISPR